MIIAGFVASRSCLYHFFVLRGEQAGFHYDIKHDIRRKRMFILPMNKAIKIIFPFKTIEPRNDLQG